MKTNVGRRDFIKVTAGIGGIAMAGANMLKAAPAKATGAKTAAGLRLAPMENIRAGIIGCGARSGTHINHLIAIDGVTITGICDIHEPSAKNAQKICIDKGQPEPALYTDGDHAYRKMLESGTIDIVYILTPWEWHVPMAVDAMEAGVHAFIEVPAAVTLDECWQLVDTAEKTQKHCMMLENCCYGREELMVLNMCRQGAFGQLTYGEGAYIHELRGQMNQMERGTGAWRTLHHTHTDGNIYPTHGLGPIAQYMNINRGDRFTYLTSMSSPALGRAEYAAKTWPADHPRNQLKYICGDMNVSLIKTAKERMVCVKHDTTTPRPYTRINLIQGTQGIFRGYPERVAIQKYGNAHSWQDINKCHEDFDHPLWTKMKEDAAKHGGHGGMDFIMNWRVIYCLRNGLPLDQDVYDAAAWSAVTELSARSVARKSAGVEFPDFTRGQWKTMKPLGIIEG
jgi:hypothetical protein